jgi:hypothetical protein
VALRFPEIVGVGITGTKIRGRSADVPSSTLGKEGVGDGKVGLVLCECSLFLSGRFSEAEATVLSKTLLPRPAPDIFEYGESKSYRA